MVGVLLFLLPLGVLLTSGIARAGTAPSSLILQRTLDAMEKGLDFMTDNYDKINLDGVIGTRIVEGQLKVLLSHLNTPSGDQVTQEVYEQISRLYTKADHVSSSATPLVQQNQPHYYHRIGAILTKGFWALDYPSRDIDKSLVLPPLVKGEAMHEEDSDDCLTEFFGTGGKTEQTCRISMDCWEKMTAPGYRSYSLSHEVFYLQIGQQFGCLKGRVLPLIDKMNAGFCANMYDEALEIAQMGIPATRQDLFMEIPCLCGMLGYRQFFRDDWLEDMLSWQWPRGCWGDHRKARKADPRDQTRFKREEKQLENGCEFHRTAVALGALVEYTRFIIEFINQGVLTH